MYHKLKNNVNDILILEIITSCEKSIYTYFLFHIFSIFFRQMLKQVVKT